MILRWSTELETLNTPNIYKTNTNQYPEKHIKKKHRDWRVSAEKLDDGRGHHRRERRAASARPRVPVTAL